MTRPLLLAALAALLALPAAAGVPARKRTLTYAVKGRDTLRMDLFDHPAAAGARRPVFIYIFGGGWEAGARSTVITDCTGILQRFADEGYVAVAIDYRLGYRQARERGEVPPGRSVVDFLASPDTDDGARAWDAVTRAVRMGVEDLYDATAFLVDKAGALGIDPRRIAVSGGSAGAVNALTAEYLLCAGDTLARAHLPEGFGYGCVITFAGGVWTDAQGPLEWRVKPCPLLMFHGSDDPLVPYRTSPRARGAAHGVADIARQMEERRWPYALYTYDGYDHSVAGLPMFLNVDDMLSFLRRAERGENLLLDIHQRPGGRHDGAWMSATMQRYEAEHHTGKPF